MPAPTTPAGVEGSVEPRRTSLWVMTDCTLGAQAMPASTSMGPRCPVTPPVTITRVGWAKSMA